MTCVQRGPDFDVLLPKSLFVGDSLASRFASVLTLSAKPVGTHSFSILAQMLKDPELGPDAVREKPERTAEDNEDNEDADEAKLFPLMQVLDKRGELIRKYAEQWTVNANDKSELQAKLDELSSFVALLYGVAGLQEGKEFKADFFT